jgi:hypothetical protein
LVSPGEGSPQTLVEANRTLLIAGLRTFSGECAMEFRFHFHLNQDVVAGLTFMAIGAFFLFFGWNYAVGSTLRMGPGYMPMLLGWLVVTLGAGIVAKGSLSEGDKLQGWAFRPLVLVSFAFLAFSWLIESLGLIVTGVAAMLIAAIAGQEFKWREQLTLSLCLALASAALFIHGLGLPIRYWPGIVDFLVYGS